MKRKRKFVVCVTDFGAKGDGLSDDTPAFRAAMNSRASVIKLPARRWSVDSVLQVEHDHRFLPTYHKRLS